MGKPYAVSPFRGTSGVPRTTVVASSRCSCRASRPSARPWSSSSRRPFIAWALDHRDLHPEADAQVFPRRLDAFILVSALLFLAQMTTVLWVSETQEVEEAHAETTGGHAEGEGEGTETTGGGEETPAARRRPAASTRRRRRRGRRQGGLRERGLRQLPHARRRGRDGHRRAEPRRGEAPGRARRRPGDERDGRDAAVLGPAERRADPGRRGVRRQRDELVSIPFGPF